MAKIEDAVYECDAANCSHTMSDDGRIFSSAVKVELAQYTAGASGVFCCRKCGQDTLPTLFAFARAEAIRYDNAPGRYTPNIWGKRRQAVTKVKTLDEAAWARLREFFLVCVPIDAVCTRCGTEKHDASLLDLLDANKTHKENKLE